MVKIGIVTGSTRDARVNTQVAEYVLNKAAAVEGAEFEIVDIKDFNLPSLNENMPAAMANKQYETPEAKAWSEKIDSLDGFIFLFF